MKYQHVFFDLDHTLWDYDTSARHTLSQLYTTYELAGRGAKPLEQFIHVFFEVNEGLWDQYNKGQISKYVLRTERFRRVFDAAGVIPRLCTPEVVADFNRDYLDLCPQQPNLVSGALEVLDALHGQFHLHIITNGFNEAQGVKMEKSGLSPYFQEVITSEAAGAKKPAGGIFDFALKKTGATRAGSLMIGDNLSTDIRGAREYGMDQVYYNPEGKTHNEPVSHEISHLKEVIDILG